MERQNDPTERQRQIRELASRIAKERIAPHAAECDRSGSFPLEAIRFLGEAGLPGLIISETEGGAGQGRPAVIWDGKDRQGRTVPAGIYPYRIETSGGILLSGKVTVSR